MAVGGTGAYAGITGTQSSAALPTGLPPVNTRQASVVEDPAYRRINRGGARRYIFSINAPDPPRVMAVSHADFSPVTTAKPDVASETLSLIVNGLGPVRPGIEAGQPFPESQAMPVNSPVTVMVNGQPVEVSAAVGFPGMVNRYQVDFQLPASAKGMTMIQPTAAWITGPPMTLNVP